MATPAVVEGGSTPADAIAWSDENEWEPTPHDVLEYARFLGATPDECARDGRMLEVARRGLCAALPPNWRPCKAPDGKRFYFDASVGTSQWEHPSDAIFREEVRRLKQTTTTAAILQAPPPGRAALADLSNNAPSPPLPRQALLAAKALTHAGSTRALPPLKHGGGSIRKAVADLTLTSAHMPAPLSTMDEESSAGSDAAGIHWPSTRRPRRKGKVSPRESRLVVPRTMHARTAQLASDVSEGAASPSSTKTAVSPNASSASSGGDTSDYGAITPSGSLADATNRSDTDASVSDSSSPSAPPSARVAPRKPTTARRSGGGGGAREVRRRGRARRRSGSLSSGPSSASLSASASASATPTSESHAAAARPINPSANASPPPAGPPNSPLRLNISIAGEEAPGACASKTPKDASAVQDSALVALRASVEESAARVARLEATVVRQSISDDVAALRAALRESASAVAEGHANARAESTGGAAGGGNVNGCVDQAGALGVSFQNLNADEAAVLRSLKCEIDTMSACFQKDEKRRNEMLEEARMQHKEVRSQLEGARAEIARLEKERTQCAEEARHDLERARAAEAEAAATCDRLRDEIAELKLRHETARRESDERFQGLMTKCKGLEALQETLAMRSQEDDDKCRKLEASLASMGEKMSDLTGRLSESTKEKFELISRLSLSMNERNALIDKMHANKQQSEAQAITKVQGDTRAGLGRLHSAMDTIKGNQENLAKELSSSVSCALESFQDQIACYIQGERNRMTEALDGERERKKTADKHDGPLVGMLGFMDVTRSRLDDMSKKLSSVCDHVLEQKQAFAAEVSELRTALQAQDAQRRDELASKESSEGPRIADIVSTSVSSSIKAFGIEYLAKVDEAIARAVECNFSKGETDTMGDECATSEPQIVDHGEEDAKGKVECMRRSPRQHTRRQIASPISQEATFEGPPTTECTFLQREEFVALQSLIKRARALTKKAARHASRSSLSGMPSEYSQTFASYTAGLRSHAKSFAFID